MLGIQKGSAALKSESTSKSNHSTMAKSSLLDIKTK